MDNFRREVLKVEGPRKHKIRNSNGIYDAYKYIRKNKWFNIGRPLTEHEFYTIVRQVNNYLADNLINGEDIILPYKMGTLELRKYTNTIEFCDGKLVTSLPIDWDRTLKLWSEDEEAYKEKTLVKVEDMETFKVIYNKKLANYTNKSFYFFEINRDIKRGLKQKIKNKSIDAFKL